MNKVIIHTYPRIHISLIGMNNYGYRVNGGAGFAISDPEMSLMFEIANSFSIIDNRKIGLTSGEVERWHRVMSECFKDNCFEYAYSCTINGNIPPHCGLGTCTSIYLASIEAMFLLNGKSYEEDTIIQYSQRGRTSGIGINTYFKGGFVFDIGVKNNRQVLLPSSVQKSLLPRPLMLYHGDVPDWKIGICMPSSVQTKSEEEEIVFFQNNCVQQLSDSYRVLYEIVNGVTASLIESDYSVFCDAVNNLQECYWKLTERKQYGIVTKKLENFLKTHGAHCVGMSSFGPLIFFTADNVQGILDSLYAKQYIQWGFVTSFNNQGRRIEYA